ncbi:MAG: 4Fe-4S dicluster domain-containing protein [Thermodesulfobacteriota bacterium]|nr:4Fe-4S dicluster domain-containing protein [Thermodesulfobacteriota bacterium]
MNIQKLRDEAKRALGRKEVQYLIGYQKGSYGFRVSPVFIDKKEEVDRLIFSPLCALSLVNYLTIEGKPSQPLDDKKSKPKQVALFVRGCDSRALNQIIAEKGISPDSLYIIGIPCTGVIDLNKIEERFPNLLDPAEVAEEEGNFIITIKDQSHTIPTPDLLAETCKTCQHPTPLNSKQLVGDKQPGNPADYNDIESLEEFSPEERWNFWQSQFNRCIRCYACKNSCPLCYCDGCILDKLKPQWIKRSVDSRENFMFHLTRAFHLAGRCISCGECERVCPVDIPLMKLNRKLEKDIKEQFDFEAGVDPELKPLLNTFTIEDPEDFIL